MNSHQSQSFAPAKIRVLLMENGCGSLGEIQKLLSQTSATEISVDCISNVVDAATYLGTNSHDVCIISSEFDERSALLDLAQQVHSVVPFIVLTSDSASEVIAAFHAGAADCICKKDLTAPSLEQSICKVLRQTRLTAAQLENEQRYFGFIENAKDIIYTHDLKGNYLSANKAAELLTGYSREEILSLKMSQVIPEEYHGLTRAMVQRKLDEQTETSYEVEFITKDGRLVPVEVNSHLIFRSGKPIAVQGIARDISQRRSFESALRASEERYRDLFENANDIVYVHDLEGNLTALNNAGELITEYPREEALGKNIFSIIAPECLETALSMMSLKARGEGPTVYEVDIITKSGRRMAVEISTRLVLRDGKPVGVQGIGREVTERKRSELERRVILEIIQSVTLTSNLDDLLHQVHIALAKILYAENCFVALYDQETNLVNYSFWRDKFDEIPPPTPIERTFSCHLVKTGEPLLLTEELKQRMYELGEVEQEGTDCASWLGVPLKTPTQTIGALVVQHYEDPNAYTQRDLEFLSSVGAQIALAIERKRAEQALKKSEAEYRDIFNNSPVGVYRSTLEGNLITANPALARILDYSSVGELLTRNLAVDMYLDTQDRTRMIDRCLNDGLAEGFEVRWKKKDGTPIWVQLCAKATRDENGEVAFFDGFIHDITQRQEAEAALRESEERYEQLVELSPDGIIVHSEGVISFVNGSGARLIGAASAQDLIGQSIYDYVDQTQHDRFTERVAKLQDGQSLPPAEMRARRLDGNWLECEVMSVPFNANGRPGVQVVVRDITERKHSELALDEANRRALADYERLVERIASLGQNLSNARDLQSILRAIRDFTMVSAPCDGMIISLYQPKEHLRHPVYCWVDGVEMQTDDMAFPVGGGLIGRALQTGTIFISNNYQKLLQEGNPMTIGDSSQITNSVLCAPMVIMGRTVGCIEIQSYNFDAYTDEHKTAMRLAASLAANAVENVSLMEREQEKEEQFRQSQKMEAIGKLAGGVAHDFNNLLTAISGYSDLGLRRIEETNPLRKNLEEIKKASTRATSLTRQLLAFSRKQMLQAKVIDVNSIVADIDRMLRRLIGEDIDLLTILDPKSCQVKADPGQIEQVILNLAVNARDAMPRGGKITIETQQVYLDDVYTRAHVAIAPGHYVMLAVSDTGVGMDQQTQQRVFEPFFTTKEVGKGTGLGLSTVYGIVKQSGGSVWLYSEIGKGSTFKVYLPLVNEPVETAEQKSQGADFKKGNETILIVEDEAMVRNLSLKILEMNGYRVLTAANGEEACKVCADFPNEIHLMVTDVVMPQMSGREVAEYAAKVRPDMSVLFMSGYTDDAIVRHGVLDNGVPFLQKPFTPDALIHKVRLILENATVKS